MLQKQTVCESDVLPRFCAVLVKQLETNVFYNVFARPITKLNKNKNVGNSISGIYKGGEIFIMN